MNNCAGCLRIVLMLAGAIYVLSPVDAMPGPIDDAAVVLADAFVIWLLGFVGKKASKG